MISFAAANRETLEGNVSGAFLSLNPVQACDDEFE